MTNDPARPVALDAYDRLASGYDERGDTKPANAYHERPATVSLLPSVGDADAADPRFAGGRVLDAGCGSGHLTRILLDRGADVVGVDVSREMLGYARERASEASFARVDLGSPLPFGDDVFAGVVSSLAFHYVEDWGPLFRELRRVVAPGGWVVCSVQHPHADFEEYEGSEDYHAIERVSATWESFGDAVEVPAYRRPLAAMLKPALSAGFSLDDLTEAKPTDEYRVAAPERYAYESAHPTFLCLRFVAPG